MYCLQNGQEPVGNKSKAVVIGNLRKVGIGQGGRNLMCGQHFYRLIQDPVGVIADIVMQSQDKENLQHNQNEP